MTIPTGSKEEMEGRSQSHPSAEAGTHIPPSPYDRASLEKKAELFDSIMANLPDRGIALLSNNSAVEVAPDGSYVTPEPVGGWLSRVAHSLLATLLMVRNEARSSGVSFPWEEAMVPPARPTRSRMSDPLEEQIAVALDAAGIAFLTGEGGHNPTGLDFYLPDADLHIEVKRFHADRVAAQMARALNVIAVQGAPAVAWLADLLNRPSGSESDPAGYVLVLDLRHQRISQNARWANTVRASIISRTKDGHLIDPVWAVLLALPLAAADFAKEREQA